MVLKKMVSCGACLFVTSLQVGSVDLFLPFAVGIQNLFLRFF